MNWQPPLPAPVKKLLTGLAQANSAEGRLF